MRGVQVVSATSWFKVFVGRPHIVETEANEWIAKERPLVVEWQALLDTGDAHAVGDMYLVVEYQERPRA